MSDINISCLDKAEVLAALYNNARPQGLGFLHYTPEDMSTQEAEELLDEQKYFDYLYGRVMKVNLTGSTFDSRLYDRDNGDGAALRAIQHLLDKKG